MNELLITPEAAKLLRQMVVSCGTINCVETMRLLDGVTEPVPLAQIAKVEGYGFRLKAFERIFKFAKQENVEEMDIFEMARYFGGKLHIEIMSDYSGHAGLGGHLGEAAGLVTHVLLPLDEKGEYHNGNKHVRFENTIHLNPDEKGIPCFHLGCLVNVPISRVQADQILREQSDSKAFMEALAQLPEIVKIPENYYQSLNCLAKK